MLRFRIDSKEIFSPIHKKTGFQKYIPNHCYISECKIKNIKPPEEYIAQKLQEKKLETSESYVWIKIN